MSEMTLLSLWLSECDASREPLPRFTGTLNVGLDVDEFKASLVQGELDVVIELGFSVQRIDDSELLCDASAAFQARYQAPQRPSSPALSAQVLSDVWPLWRGWLLQTLALMGGSAQSVPAALPPEMIQLGAEALSFIAPDAPQ